MKRCSVKLSILGIDLSLKATGLAHGWGTETLTFPDEVDTLDRIDKIERRVWELVVTPCVAVLEGPSFRSNLPSAHERAGLWWGVRRTLRDMSVPVAVVTPAAVKKYATGNGTASKQEVLAAVIRRYPDFTGTNDNEADAYVLRAMGLDHYGLRYCDLQVPKPNRAALTKIKWPEVRA